MSASRHTSFVLLTVLGVGLFAACGPQRDAAPVTPAPPAKPFAEMSVLELQEACLRYRAPADQVVVEQNPVAAARLLKADPQNFHDYWLHPYDNGFQNFAVKPDDAGPVAMRIAPPWRALTSRVNFRPKHPNYNKGGTIFCGERFTPSGERRLLVIQYVTTPTAYLYWSPSVDLVVLVITPGNSQEPPKDYALAHGHGVWLTNVVVPPPLRIYAGQPDPKDATRVSFGYQLADKRDVVDVVLTDNESVIVTPRKPFVRRGWGDASIKHGGTTVRGTPDGGIEIIEE